MPTLQPFQYRLGDGPIFGRNTMIPISNVDVAPYNVNNQDFQVNRTDEIRFGIDTLAPGPIMFVMGLLLNEPAESVIGITGERVYDSLFIGLDSNLPELAKTWKARDVRMSWGNVMPLRFCDKRNVIHRIYGRPGKFAWKPRTNANASWIDVQAEFRRMDTVSYNDIEYFVGDPVDPERGLSPNAPAVLAERDEGDADSWLRILVRGPATHPIIFYGDSVIELNMTIPAGKIVEVSSYPWQRRVVDNDGVNHRRKLIGATKYLDEIVFPSGYEYEVRWEATGTNTESQLFFMWREAYNVF